ncbi:MAG: nicotinate phosphoribosyltransferase, partial [Armatimonadota bacterium]
MLHTASLDEIRAGKVTDVYFERALAAIEAAGLDKQVAAEITASSFPRGYDWALLAGIEEAVGVLRGLECDVEAMPEGTLFYPGEPVLRLSGMYSRFCVYETCLLGFLCQASGIATKAARIRLAAGERTVISFGARRMHPTIAPMIERNAYIGGCDGFAVVKTSDFVPVEASGTMPHALVLCAGNLADALRAFDAANPPGVPRVALIDTFEDEKFAALIAAETLGEKLSGVRLDTPGSRRGDFAAIMREVRWELDAAGFEHVKIFASGGLDEDTIPELNEIADGYGVGTCMSNADVINLGLDIIEIEGEAVAKRGKLSGRKAPMRCDRCGAHGVAPEAGDTACPRCGRPARSALEP